MNGLPLPRLALRESLNSPWNFTPPRRSHECPRRQFQPNTPFRSLALRQLQRSTKNVLELPPNVLTPVPYPLTRNDSASRTPLNRLIPPYKAERYWCQSTTLSANIKPAEPIANIVPIKPITLEKDLHFRAEACIAFSFELFNTTTGEAISRFQVQITNVIKYINHICYCCSRFVDPIELNLIPDN